MKSTNDGPQTAIITSLNGILIRQRVLHNSSIIKKGMGADISDIIKRRRAPDINGIVISDGFQTSVI